MEDRNATPEELKITKELQILMKMDRVVIGSEDEASIMGAHARGTISGAIAFHKEGIRFMLDYVRTKKDLATDPLERITNELLALAKQRVEELITEAQTEKLLTRIPTGRAH